MTGQLKSPCKDKIHFHAARKSKCDPQGGATVCQIQTNVVCCFTGWFHNETTGQVYIFILREREQTLNQRKPQ